MQVSPILFPIRFPILFPRIMGDARFLATGKIANIAALGPLDASPNGIKQTLGYVLTPEEKESVQQDKWRIRVIKYGNTTADCSVLVLKPLQYMAPTCPCCCR